MIPWAAAHRGRLKDGVCVGRFVVLTSGYYMGTVEAVQATLTVQLREAGSGMQPRQYGRPQAMPP